MRRAQLVAVGRIEVGEATVPRPDPGGVVVRIRVALTDGTDLKAYRRGHPQMPMPTPFGHEFSGDVVAIGSAVTSFVPGDAIMCVHSAPCGACFWCTRAEEELCVRVMETKILGAYAEAIAVPAHIVARNAYRKPSSLSYEAAAFLEPLACVVHAWEFARPSAAPSVVIVGDGGFGLLHALYARVLGAACVVLIGRRPARLALARKLGADVVFDARTEGLVGAIAAATEGRGADVVVESTGAAGVWEAAPRYARRGGVVVLFGGLPAGTRVGFDAARLHYDEVRLASPFHFTPRAVRRAAGLLTSGAIDPRPLISARYPLAEVAAAFAALDGGDALKIAVLP